MHDSLALISQLYIYIYMTLALITGISTENDVGSYFGMDGSALSPSRGQKHTISQ